MDGGAWWAAVHGVAKSWTRLSDFPFTFHFHALEKEMATHSSVLAWRIPGMVEPGGLPYMGSHRFRHDWSDLAAAEEEKEKKKGYEKIFEEIIVENYPNMEKEIVNQVQEAWRVPYRINLRRNTPRYILIKLTKNKHKERILEAAREKQQVTYKGNSICLTANLSAESLQARREWQDIFKVQFSSV